MKILIILFILILLLLYILRGRTGQPGLASLRKWSYAHRGLHSEGIPENSMAAYQAALDAGFGIELDVHMLKDGNLAIMHDSALMRTTGQEGFLEDLTTEQLKDYHLSGTEQTIPTFRSVIELFAGKAPMIVELKTKDGNADKLTRAACDMLDQYPITYCMESFDPRCIRWLKENRPDIIRGQLSENFIPPKPYSVAVPKVLRWCMTYNLPNCMTRPDFIAYRFEDRKTVTNWICRRILGIQGVSWTIRSKKDYDIAVKEGWIPIFENFIP